MKRLFIVLLLSTLCWAQSEPEPLYQLGIAVNAGEYQKTKGLLDRNRSLVDGVPSGFYVSQTLLQLAVSRKDEKIVELLLDRGADPNLAAGNLMGTPVSLAASNGSAALVERLLKAGAKPDPQALQMAVLASNLKMTKLLLDKGWAVDELSFTNAAGLGNPPLLKVLLEKSVLLTASDRLGRTAIHISAANADIATTKLLLKYGFSVNQSCEVPTTGVFFLGGKPLHMASKSPTMTRFLLERGGDPKVLDQQKKTPLHLATSNLNLETVKVLLAAGASLDAQDSAGRTPLHEVVDPYSAGQPDSRPTQRLAVASYLLEEDANPNAPDNNGYTVLHHAAFAGHTQLVKQLLDGGADPNSKAAGDRTPMHFAAQKARLGVAKVLMAAGAQPNAADSSGLTVAGLAKKCEVQGWQEFVKLVKSP